MTEHVDIDQARQQVTQVLNALWQGGESPQQMIDRLIEAISDLGGHWTPPPWTGDGLIETENGRRDMPDFNIDVTPALTLADTKIHVSRSSVIAGPELVLEDAVVSWLHKHHPELRYGGFGSQHGILPARLRTSLHVLQADLNPSVRLTPTAIGHRVVDNSESDVDQEATVDFSDSLTVESSIGWEQSVTAGVSFTVGVEAGGEFVKSSASTTVSLETTVGQSKSESRSIEVGVTEGEQVKVPPGEIALLIGLLQRGTLAFDVPVGWRPDDDQEIRVFGNGSSHLFIVRTTDLAAAHFGDVQQAQVVLPFASEAQSKVIAPLADDSSQSVEAGLRRALAELGDGS